MITKWWKQVCIVLLSLAIGGTGGWYLHQTTPALYKGATVRQSNTPYRYISPLLACDIGTQDAFPEFTPLKAQLEALVAQKTKAGDAQRISIYVRSLRSSRWFEINPNATYAPASLLKVFVMMAYYKEADDADSPQLLDKQITFEGSVNPATNTPGEEIPHLTNGQSYSVNRIIKQMIAYSDNDALNTLVDNFDPKTLTAFQNIFFDLNIPSPVSQSEGSLNFMTVDNYSLIFRVLYGATYLSNRYSEQAMALLAEAQYKDGIAAGVPAALTVAHKFGVTTVPAAATGGTSSELHDCGIVYYPNNHQYLLCVMTEGTDFAKLQKAIKDISAVSYAWLDNYYTHLPIAATTTPSVQ